MVLQEEVGNDCEVEETGVSIDRDADEDRI
jgi:hypothetical protein